MPKQHAELQRIETGKIIGI